MNSIISQLRWLGAFALPFILTVQLHAADDKAKWCLPGSEYANVLAGKVADLRWSLGMLSLAETEKKIEKPVMVDLAKGSLISLANILSLRADYLTSCTMEQAVYNSELRHNEVFARLLFDVTSADSFPTIKKDPTLAPNDDPTRSQKFEMLQPEITDLLTQVALSNNAFSNPFHVGAGLLLGKLRAEDVDEAKILPKDRTAVNQEGILYGKTLQESQKVIESSDSRTLLEALRRYYSKLEIPRASN